MPAALHTFSFPLFYPTPSNFQAVFSQYAAFTSALFLFLCLYVYMHTCVCMYIQIQNRTHLFVFIYTYLCMCSLCLLAVCTRAGFVLGSTGGHQLCGHSVQSPFFVAFFLIFSFIPSISKKVGEWFVFPSALIGQFTMHISSFNDSFICSLPRNLLAWHNLRC